MLTGDELALLQSIRDGGSLCQAAALLAPSTIRHAARQLDERCGTANPGVRQGVSHTVSGGVRGGEHAGRTLKWWIEHLMHERLAA